MKQFFSIKHTDKELNNYKGKFVEDFHKDILDKYQIINEDMDGYDKDSNEVIFKLRKKVINPDIISNYEHINFNYNNNRGISAGKLDLDRVKNIDKRGYKQISEYKYVREKKDGSFSNYQLCNPVKSNVIGFFDYIQYKKIKDNEKVKIRNIKITDNTNENSLESLEEITKLADKYYQSLYPEIYQKSKKHFQDIGFEEYLYKTTMFSTITVNTDFRTALHKDADNYAGLAIMAVLDNSENKFKGGELYLPKYRLKLKIESGDIIFFKNKEYHTNAKIEGGNRFSFVFYIRENLRKFYLDIKAKSGEVVYKTYLEDLFIDYNKPAILLNVNNDKYNNYKKKIIDYAKNNDCLIYRLSDKTSFNRRSFGDYNFRYLNEKNLKKFSNPIFVKDLCDNCYETKDYCDCDEEEEKVKKLTKKIKKLEIIEEIKEEIIEEEIDYVVAVRSHKRSDTINNKTLKLLKDNNIPMDKVYIFCCKTQFEDYRKTIDPKITLIDGGSKGTAYCSRAIRLYFPENKYIIYMDDDVKKLYKCYSLKRKDDKDYPLLKLIKEGYMLMKKHKTTLWGTYPVNNSFFMFNQKEITTDLRFCIGRICGYFNEKDIMVKDDCRDDYERTFLTYKKHKKIIRFNKISVIADTYVGKGGLAEVRDIEKMENSVKYMIETYPEYCARKKTSKNRIFPEIRIIKQKS